ARSEVEVVGNWLSRLEVALETLDRQELGELFADECHWRDMLAITWNITPHEGRSSIVNGFVGRQGDIQARDFKIAEKRTPPRRVKRIGIPVIEAIFSFETAVGRCHGIVRLLESEPERAWVLMTSLQELKGYEPAVGDRRPSGAEYSRQFGGPNWAERR